MTASTVAAMRAAWHRRRWLVVPAFLFPLVMGLSLVLFLPKMYRSTATVLIEGQKVPEAFVKATVTGEIETRIRGISEQVLSRSRLETLISRFNLYPELRGKGSAERAIAQMREDISLDLKSARASYGSTVVAFTIGFRGPDPVAVADVANALASFYIEENVKLRERQSSGTTSFLEAQLADTRKRLDEQERLVSAFNRRHLGELPSQMQANLATLESLNTQLRLNMDRQTRASDRRSILNRQVEDFNVMWSAARAAGAPSPAVGPAPAAVDPLMARRAQLQQELSVARTRYTESHPSLARLKAELAELERQVGAREVEPVPPGQPAPERPPAGLHPQAQRLHEAIAEIDVELKALSGEEQRLTADITTYRARVENTPRREQEYQELSRDYVATKELYASLLKRYEEARLAESMEQGQKGEQFRVLDLALPGADVAAPNKPRLLVLVLAASAGLAGAALVIAEKLDTSFHSVDDLRAFTRVPVLAAIPRIVTARDRRRQQWFLGLATTSMAVALLVAAGLSYRIAHGNETLVRLLMRG